METEKAIELAGGKHALADLLNITPQAIYNWGETVPKGREWELRGMYPEWFGINAPAQSALRRKRERLVQQRRLDRILRLADEIKKEVQLWRTN